MKGKRLKVLVSLITVMCLMVSLSYSVLALSITGISSVVNYDGSVSVKATLSGYTSGDNLTVKVEDTLAKESIAANKIKYIDQVAPTLDAWGNYVLAFKLRDVNTNVGRDYLLSVGGTGISSVTNQKLFRTRQKAGVVASLSFVKVPNVLRKGDSIKELLGVVAYDASGNVVTLTNSDLTWSVETTGTSLTISSTGELSGTLAPGFASSEFTIKAAVSSNAAISAHKNIKVIDSAGKIAILNDSNLLKATSAISQSGSGTIGISKNSVTGNYVAKKPVVKNTLVSFSVPTITGTNVQYSTRYKKVGDANFTTGSSFTPTVSGIYVVEMLTYENSNVTDFATDGEVKQTIYFRVVESLTDANANLIVRGEAGAGETSFDVSSITATYSAGTLNISVANIDPAKYEFKYFYLPAGSGENTKDAWVTLSSDYTVASHSGARAGITTGAKVAVYVRLKGSTNPVEAYRIKTIDIQ